MFISIKNVYYTLPLFYYTLIFFISIDLVQSYGSHIENMLISMLVNQMKVRVKYAYMLNKSSLDMSEEIIFVSYRWKGLVFVVSEFNPRGVLGKWFCFL